jgi:hypothetical protein
MPDWASRRRFKVGGLAALEELPVDAGRETGMDCYDRFMPAGVA